jgi:uncharacterized protein (DUF1499 family)
MEGEAMGILGLLFALVTAFGVVALNPTANPWALGVGLVGGLIAAYLTRTSGRWALIMAFMALAVLGGAILGVQGGQIPWQMALGFGIGGGLLLALQAGVSGLFSLAIGDHKQTAFVAIVAAAAIAYVPLTQVMKARSVPPIHDISTDLADPPAFVAVVPLRKKANASNPPEYAGPETAEQQKTAYADIEPVVLAVAPSEAFAKALAAAKGMPDWEIVEENAAEGRIEATATSRFLRFQDDVVIRVRQDAAGSRVDIRSKSRVGRSDVGANAERIRAYVAKLKAQ